MKKKSKRRERRLSLAEAAFAENKRLKDDPNVSCVGYGLKFRQGKPIMQACLQYHVFKKFPDEKAIKKAGSTPIARKAHGHLTDVIEVKKLRPAQCPEDKGLPTGDRGIRREDPLVGGTSTAVLGRYLSFPTGYGTLGGICFSNSTGKAMALSNAHVWGSELGIDVVQPLIPVEELFDAGIELLTCGPVIALIAEETRPSVLTGVLAGAAEQAWIIAIALDAKDPHRRGQEGTVPTQPDEHTITETVRFTAMPKDLPLPGTPFRSEVHWNYQRQTDRATYPFSVSEPQTNQHVLVRKHLWTNKPEYKPGRDVEIMAMLETTRVQRPDAYHVVVHLVPANQPDRLITRVLHPATCNLVPFLCVSFARQKIGSKAKFPLRQQGIVFSASGAGSFCDLWPTGAPDGKAELQFPGEGLKIETPLSLGAEVRVVQLNPEPIVLEAYDSQNNLLDKATTPGTEYVEHVLVVNGHSITRLMLRGGGNEGLLLQICLRLLKSQRAEPMSSENHIFCYKGRLKLDPTESLGSWKGLLSAQTVNDVPAGTPPTEAAATIGGTESAVLATCPSCIITLALDHLFDVV